MKTKKNELSTIRINRIREQGYTNQCNQEINDLAFGHRFAFRFCTTLLIIGVVFSNIPLLSVMLCIAFFGVVLPYHPFDYIYNHVLSKRMHLPKLPRRSPQLKFACANATLFIGGTIILFNSNFILAGYALGGLLIGVALLVSTIDFCIPSIIFNSIIRTKTKLI